MTSLHSGCVGTGHWSQMHKQEHHNSYYQQDDQITECKRGGICRMHKEDGNVHKVLLGKPQGNRTLVRPKHGWKDVRMCVHWIQVAHSTAQWLAKAVTEYPPGVGATSDVSMLNISSTLESDWRACTGCFAADPPWESAAIF